MKFFIHLKKEITLTAIEYNGQITILYLVYLINGCMFVPTFPIGSILSQLFIHLPVQRERTDIHSTAGTAGSTKYIFMTEGIPQSTVATHTQSCNRTPLRCCNRLIMTIRINNQFRRYKCFITV